MQNKVTIVLLFILLIYSLITIGNIIHESMHLFQVNFNYTEYCFVGYKPGAIAWVTPLNLNESDKPRMEKQARFYEIGVTFPLAIIIGLFMGVKLKQWDN